MLQNISLFTQFLVLHMHKNFNGIFSVVLILKSVVHQCEVRGLTDHFRNLTLIFVFQDLALILIIQHAFHSVCSNTRHALNLVYLTFLQVKTNQWNSLVISNIFYWFSFKLSCCPLERNVGGEELSLFLQRTWVELPAPTSDGLPLPGLAVAGIWLLKAPAHSHIHTSVMF